METLRIKTMETKMIDLLKEVNGNVNTKSFAVGGGEWSIEVSDLAGNYLFELVGSNGTRNDETPDDLWGELSGLVSEALR